MLKLSKKDRRAGGYYVSVSEILENGKYLYLCRFWVKYQTIINNNILSIQMEHCQYKADVTKITEAIKLVQSVGELV